MGFPVLTELQPQGEKLIRYMKAKGYTILALNIVNIEGMDTDLKTLNDDAPDEWNDARVIVSDNGDVLMSSVGTSEPGNFYTYNPMNVDGCARLAFGQHVEKWQLGYHFKQEALVQCGSLPVYRDKNQDHKRTGDKLYVGSDFGINIHTTGNSANGSAPAVVSRWSAGCQVLQHANTHYNVFMPICKAMGKTKFTLTLIDGSDFAKFN